MGFPENTQLETFLGQKEESLRVSTGNTNRGSVSPNHKDGEGLGGERGSERLRRGDRRVGPQQSVTGIGVGEPKVGFIREQEQVLIFLLLNF